jgi:L-fuconolactonase
VIVDAQVHIWRGIASRADPRQVARHGGAVSFGISDILGQLEPAGVAAAILVPPGWARDENESAIAAARRFPDRFAAVGRLDPLAAGAGLALRSWARSGVIGYRLVFSAPAVAARLHRGELDGLFAEAAASGCPLTVSVPGSLAAVRRIAQRTEGLKLIIDHLGLPAGIKPSAIGPAVGDVCALAALPNVAVKATSLPSYSALEFPHRDVQLLLRRVIDAFGPARVFWASDLTKHLGRYQDVLAVTLGAVAALPPPEQDLVMGAGVCRWLGWRQARPP